MRDPSDIVKKSSNLDRSRNKRYELALQIAPDYPHNTAHELYDHIQDIGYYWDGRFAFWSQRKAKQYEGMASNEIKVRIHGTKEMLQIFREEFCEFLKERGYKLRDRQTIRITPVSPLEKEVYVGYAVICLDSED